MRAIGFRAEPGAIFWAVVEGPILPLKMIDSGKLQAPNVYNEADSLVWYRTEVRTLADQYRPDRAGVRYPEPSARVSKPSSTHKRVRIEGVILEALSSKKVAVLTGALVTLTSQLGTESASAYLQSDGFRGLDCSKIKDKKRKEAILVAAAALGAHDADRGKD